MQVLAIEAQYGVDLSATKAQQLQTLYDMYLQSLIPGGDAPLTYASVHYIKQSVPLLSHQWVFSKWTTTWPMGCWQFPDD